MKDKQGETRRKQEEQAAQEGETSEDARPRLHRQRLKELDVTDEIGRAVKGGVPKIPDMRER